ncbi:unnamed protein product [Amoebophrya sp. A25]|nr:unnamed protein product [Amoebophrya sp. A25]|eukprot:GSA25T00010564001.1
MAVEGQQEIPVEVKAAVPAKEENNAAKAPAVVEEKKATTSTTPDAKAAEVDTKKTDNKDGAAASSTSKDVEAAGAAAGGASKSKNKRKKKAAAAASTGEEQGSKQEGATAKTSETKDPAVASTKKANKKKKKPDAGGKKDNQGNKGAAAKSVEAQEAGDAAAQPAKGGGKGKNGASKGAKGAGKGSPYQKGAKSAEWQQWNYWNAKEQAQSWNNGKGTENQSASPLHNPVLGAGAQAPGSPAQLGNGCEEANRWEAVHFVGDFTDTLGHDVAVFEVPARVSATTGLQTDSTFHAHLSKQGVPDKRFTIARKMAPRGFKKCWQCGNGYFCKQMSTADRIVWRTEDGKESIWTRKPPVGAVWFDPPPHMTIDVAAAMDEWRAQQLGQLEVMLANPEMANVGTLGGDHGYVPPYSLAGEVPVVPAQAATTSSSSAKQEQTIQVEAKQNDSSSKTGEASSSSRKVVAPDAAAATGAAAEEDGDAKKTTGGDNKQQQEPTWAEKIAAASATSKTSGSDRKTARSQSVAGQEPSPASKKPAAAATATSPSSQTTTAPNSLNSTPTKVENPEKKPEERTVVERAWPLKPLNAKAESFFPPSLEATRPKLLEDRDAKQLQVKATADPITGELFSELSWRIEENWSELKQSPQDFAVLSPHFAIAEVENVQLSFLPSGRKGSERKGCCLQVMTGNMVELGRGIELEITINGIRCETGKKCVSQRYTGDYAALPENTQAVTIVLRILSVFQDKMKIKN